MKRVESTEFDWLKECLAGRTVMDVEAGASNGWVLVHLSLTEEDKKRMPEGSQVYLTIKVDGPAEGDACHYWNAALHVRQPDGLGSVLAIRDHRPAIEDNPLQGGGTTPPC